MVKFTKKQICQVLSQIEIPIEPYFELRKVTTLSEKGFTLDYSLVPIFEPPEKYCAHQENIEKTFSGFTELFLQDGYSLKPSLSVFKSQDEDYQIEKLSDDDQRLLRDIFKITNKNYSSFPTHLHFINYYQFGDVIKSQDDFIAHCEIFCESPEKPSWDLIRVLVVDSVENCEKRQQYYVQLFNGGLDIFLKNGDLLENCGQYFFNKETRTERKPYFLTNEVAIPIQRFPELIGKNLVNNSFKQTNDNDKIKFIYQINDAVKHALFRGQLTVRRKPSFIEVEFNGVPLDGDCFLWSDIRIFLENKTGLLFPEELPGFPAPSGNSITERQTSEQKLKIIETTQASNSVIIKPPIKKDGWFDVIQDTVNELAEELKKAPNEIQVWGKLWTQPPHGYTITTGTDKGEDCLNMPGVTPLSKSAFSKRWKAYTANSTK